MGKALKVPAPSEVPEEVDYALLVGVHFGSGNGSVRFATVEDAVEFVRLCQLYDVATQGMNDGYWFLHNPPQVRTKKLPLYLRDTAVFEHALDYLFILGMAEDVCRHHGGDPDVDFTSPVIGRYRGAYTFTWADLGKYVRL